METKAIFVGFTVPPSLEDIQEIAETIIDELPEGLGKYIRKLKVITEDFPDAFVEQELELETPFDLLGCYQSAGPVVGSGHMAAGTKRQDTLYLYRRPILDQWADSSDDLTHLINRVILHEIGHHFGFTPEDIEMYEEDMFGATALRNDAG